MMGMGGDHMAPFPHRLSATTEQKGTDPAPPPSGIANRVTGRNSSGQSQPQPLHGSTTMDLFDIVLYAAAIVGVLVLRAEATQLKPVAEATAEPVLADLTTDTEVPESQPALAESAELTQPEPQAEPQPTLTPTFGMTAPQPKATTAQSPTVASLQKQCSAAGIRWRNARGKGKPMTKSQMLTALKAVSVEVASESSRGR